MTYKEQSEIRYRAILKLEAKIRQLEKENVELKTQIEKMKCCENCKYNSYWEMNCIVTMD